MAADASAYAALGLEPDADAAAIERAYKRLIKQFHPDRAGGDARRAAEINRAYRELREPSRATLTLDDLGVLARDALWPRVALWSAAAVLLLVLVTAALAQLPHAKATRGADRPQSLVATDAMDRPISQAAVEAGIRDALQLARASDEVGLAEASRACQRAMHARPAVAQLDRCAAFDDAVVQLQDRDPLRDRGPFSELAVTGRHMSAATLLSNDYLAIDGRLDRIRLQVELALAPSLSEEPAASAD